VGLEDLKVFKSIMFLKCEGFFYVMYKIKEQPDDFLVEEEGNLEMDDSGKYLYFLMTKKNYTTLRALEAIGDAIGIGLKRFGFAGSKDKNAITKQMVSVRGCSKERLDSFTLQDISVEFAGFGKEPISLGDLEGNRFDIIVRNITQKPKKVDKIKNYFGEQRFSRNNAEIGRMIVKRDFKKAVELVLEGKGDYERRVTDFIGLHETDYVGALRQIPKKILTMYVHAYQSEFWNKMAGEVDEGGVPIIGFGSDGKDVDEVLKKEGISTRDFIFREIPELSAEGGERDLYVKIKDLEIGDLEEDELNKGMKKCKVSFVLGKGSYATEVIKVLFEDC
jgi:tRNA pseudouridine13 synthase